MECICPCYVEFILFLDWDAEGERDELENWGRTRSGMPDDIADRDTTLFARRKAVAEPGVEYLAVLVKRKVNPAR